MERGTKERIMEAALQLFAQGGYVGTSMQDIAACLGITKAALYKHYGSKREILDAILEKMRQMDLEEAQAHEMPEGLAEDMPEAYCGISPETIRVYTKAMFLHWTQDAFAAAFRKMLTLEQYRDAEMAALYRMYLSDGPVAYMTDVFRPMTDSDEGARQLALALYGPIFLLYSVYDGAADKAPVLAQADRHLEHFTRFLPST